MEQAAYPKPEMPSLLVAEKYRARNHLTSGSFVFAMIVPAVAEVWWRHMGHWYSGSLLPPTTVQWQNPHLGHLKPSGHFNWNKLDWNKKKLLRETTLYPYPSATPIIPLSISPWKTWSNMTASRYPEIPMMNRAGK